MDLSTMDDGDLLTAFTDGSEKAFAELYRRRHLEIYRFILRYVHGDEDLASDMFQDTFIKVHDYAHTLRDGNTVRSWMYTIARNNCLNALKRQNRQSRLDEEQFDRVDESGLPPDQELERNDMHRALDSAISQLPENQREAVILREFEGLSYAEIAEATRTNIGVIRQRLWRAKQSLRTMLADRFEDRPAGESE
jgi:RNA polymerase sigma-70 factor (ECF subfamily)